MAWRHALLLSMLLLVACSVPEPPPAPAPAVPTAAPSPPTPVPRRPQEAASAFFSAWQQGQYSAMYDLLSAEAQAATAREVFVRRYTNIRNGIGELTLTVQQTGPASTSGQVPFQVTRTLAIFGELSETNTLPLVQDQTGA